MSWKTTASPKQCVVCGGEFRPRQSSNQSRADWDRQQTCSKSCNGRRGRPREKHGHSRLEARSSIYQIWDAMVQRCTNPNAPKYRYYGGRGIRVCDEWLVFASFLRDVGERPTGLTLDRYPNNDGNYEPGNVRWATRRQQMANTRTARRIEHGGEVHPLAEWARRMGITAPAMSKRIKRHGVDRALNARFWTGGT